MQTRPPIIRIPELNALEAQELRVALPNADVVFEEESLEGSRHGELLTTIAVVTISVAALVSLSAWLLKTRNHDVVERKLEVIHPDGSRSVETLKIDLKASSAPTAEIIQKLGQAISAPATTVGAALRQVESSAQA